MKTLPEMASNNLFLAPKAVMPIDNKSFSFIPDNVIKSISCVVNKFTYFSSPIDINNDVTSGHLADVTWSIKEAVELSNMLLVFGVDKFVK